MDAVLTAAVALLDEAGEQAFTFRSLAARLGTGVGTIYWYVASKEELLDCAADHVIADVLDATNPPTELPDAFAELRGLAVALFDAVDRRPWLAGHFMSDTEVQPNMMRLYDRIGRPLLRLRLSSRQRFHAASAVIGFVIGTAADLGRQPPREVVDGSIRRDQYIGTVADHWRRLDPTEYPFVHEILDEFAHHDDTDQFSAGLDLILAGLRHQTSSASRQRSTRASTDR